MKPSQIARIVPKLLQAREPFLLKGAPGVGKTDMITAGAAAIDMDVIVSHPVISDPTDYKGMPYVAAGVADFLPFGDLRAILEADKPTLYFLDDLGQAAPAVQAAAMQLLLARRINGHKVSDQVRFAAATNERKHKAGVSGLLEPVKSRFATILGVEVSAEDWTAWALTHGMPVELIAFNQFKPTLISSFEATGDITNSPSPRTYANLGRLYNLGLDAGDELEAYQGAVGKGAAGEFLAFAKLARGLPTADSVIIAPNSAIVPTEPSQLYAISTAVAMKANETNVGNVVAYSDRLPPEFGVFLMTSAVKIRPGITSVRPFINWASGPRGKMLSGSI